MRRSHSLATTIVLALAAAAPSQADPFQYSYNWTASPVVADGSGGVSFISGDGGRLPKKPIPWLPMSASIAQPTPAART
jgi:hypothetical protein